MTTVFADRELAARLELAVMADFEAYAAVASRMYPEDTPGRIDVGGGAGFFFGPGSPLNQAVALGMSAPVEPGAVAAVRRFFEDRDTPPVILACPLAHESLFAQLAAGGWLVADFENVMFLPLEDARRADEDLRSADVTVRRVETREDRRHWGLLSLEGFRTERLSAQAQEHLAMAVAAREDIELLVAYVDGSPAGSAALAVYGTDAWLFADSTLLNMRGRGVQQALQRARLEMSLEAGCRLAVTEASPGSASQRNMERLGFRVAYTRGEFSAPRLRAEAS